MLSKGPPTVPVMCKYWDFKRALNCSVQVLSKALNCNCSALLSKAFPAATHA